MNTMLRIRTNLLILSFITSVGFLSCSREKSFESTKPTTPGSGGTAVFGLSTTGSSCSNSSVAGTYTVGTAVSSSETVTIEVNVTTAGTWSMNTGTVSGFYFAGSGTFANAGTQNITLSASGTPTAVGSQTFAILAGSTNCSFTVTTVAGGTTNPGGGGGTGSNSTDHFPLAVGNRWVYENSDQPGDSIVTTVTGTTSLNGNTYYIFIDSADGYPSDTTLYRKSGNDYLNYARADKFGYIPFDKIQLTDILFMKENLTNGVTWTSPEYSGTASGQAFKEKYIFTCVNANSTVTVNGKTFSNTYQITQKAQISVNNSPYIDAGGVTTFYYAKGVGFIRLEAVYQGASLGEYNLINYKVN